MGDAAALPVELRTLLRAHGLEAIRAADVTALSGAGGSRRTFRIELAGSGRLVKGRIHRDPEVAARMARWLPLLEPRGFAPLLAVEGIATLEAWMAGRAAPPGDAAVAEAAGDLLGACHESFARETIGPDDPRLLAWVHDTERRLEEVRRGGHLDDERAGRVLGALRALRPTRATWGLRHGDFHADNLIQTDAGLCSIDNTTIGPALLETDLGFAFNRWPLPTPRRERFLAGYRRRGDPEPFLAHEGWWRISMALWSAAYRLAQRTGGVDVPLEELLRHVP